MILSDTTLEVGSIIYGKINKSELQPNYYLIFSIVQDEYHLFKLSSEKANNGFKLKSSAFSKAGIKNIYADMDTYFALKKSDLLICFQDGDISPYKLTTDELYNVLDNINNLANNSQTENQSTKTSDSSHPSISSFLIGVFLFSLAGYFLIESDYTRPYIIVCLMFLWAHRYIIINLFLTALVVWACLNILPVIVPIMGEGITDTISVLSPSVSALVAALSKNIFDA